MRTIIKAFLATTLITTSISSYALECTVTRGDTTITLTLEENTAFVTYGEETRAIDIVGSYDGHMTSLVTGEGFAFTFENHFGCIRNARMTTRLPHNIGDIHFPGCSGGSTPDSICF